MIEAFYRGLLNAPLNNSRWSWGSVRQSDGAVFLRVWQDEKIRRGKTLYMRLTAREFFVDKENNPGWKERQEHLKLVQAGAPTYMVMCEAVDPTADPREIRDFNNRELFVGGEIVEENGDFWLEIKNRISVHDIR